MPTLVLIGPPGSGKTTVGRALSKALGVSFVDSDKEIEKNTGRKISEIFIENGEDYFRQLEFDVLNETLSQQDCVLSLGGGAPISEPAQQAVIDSRTPIVFLDVSLSVAAPRVGFNRDRPLLLKNPRASWQSLYEIRRPIYEKLATIVVKVDSMKVDEIVEAILVEL